jgi:hypothetical protein
MPYPPRSGSLRRDESGSDNTLLSLHITKPPALYPARKFIKKPQGV